MSLAEGGFAQKQKAKWRDKFMPAVEAALEPGEEVRVCLPVSKGLGFWWMFILTPLIALFWKQYVVVLTDRRLVFLTASRGGQPGGVAFSGAPSETSVVGFTSAGMPRALGRLTILRAQEKMGLNFAWPWQPEAEVLRNALAAPAP